MARGMWFVANPITFPATISPVVDSNGKLTQIWEGLLRDLTKRAKAEAAPGRVEDFWLSAADLADKEKFMQLGAVDKDGNPIDGLGVNDYLGWAICNGNNRTPVVDGTFTRLSVSGHDAAGATGGSDSSAHTHDINHDHGSFNSGNESTHTHTSAAHTHPLSSNGYAKICSLSDNIYSREKSVTAWTATDRTDGLATHTTTNTPAEATELGGATDSTTPGATGAGSAHNHAIDVPALGVTSSGAASVTDNRPSFKSWVPLMRI